MARARIAFTRDVESVRQEIKGHQEEISDIDRELADHYGAIAQGAARREYLQDLIQANERMIVRYAKLARVRAPTRRGRRPGRPPKVAKPARRVGRGRGRRLARPVAAEPTSQKFAALSVADAAEQVLKRTGKSIHLREVTSRLIAGGKAFRTKKPEVSVLTIIGMDRRFRNTGRNMWTLV